MPSGLKRSKKSLVDEKYLGVEPVLHKDCSSIDVIRAFNWHNYYHNSDDAKSFVLTYLKSIKDKDLLKKINKVDASELRTLGWMSRSLTLGGSLPKGLEDDLWLRLKKLAAEVKREDDPVEETKPVFSIQERIDNKVSDLIATLEDQVDDFACDGKSNFNVEEYFRNHSVKPVVAKRIAEYYQPLYEEIHDALNLKDPQLEEAYDSWNRKTLTAYLNFIKTIIATAQTYEIATKITRKPRKKKEKPAALVVKKLQYKEKDDEYNIVSVNPATLVGADQLWTFNCKSRTLTVYNSLGPVGLSVRGTTIIGHDKKNSITKKVRKPQDILPRVLDGGKLVLRKLMDEINSVPKEANGRINKDTVLVRIQR